MASNTSVASLFWFALFCTTLSQTNFNAECAPANVATRSPLNTAPREQPRPRRAAAAIAEDSTAEQDEAVEEENEPTTTSALGEGPQSRSLLPTTAITQSLRARTASAATPARTPATFVSYFDSSAPSTFGQQQQDKYSPPQPYSVAYSTKPTTKQPPLSTSIDISSDDDSKIDSTAPPTPEAAAAPQQQQQPVAAAASGYDAVSYNEGPTTYQVPVYVHKDDHDDTYRTLLELFQRKINDQAGEIVSTTGMVVKNALKTQELSKSKFDQLLPYMLAMGAMFAFCKFFYAVMSHACKSK